MDYINEPAQNGQYMVEFGLTISVFIIFAFMVIDLGLLIYNHNLFYNGISQSARKASLGATNDEIRNTFYEEGISNSFPSLLTVAAPDTMVIRPENEIHRTRGRKITITMDTEFGMSMLWFGNVTMDLPIGSQSLVTQHNDVDRDGCKDELENPGVNCDSYSNFSNTFPNDHDNDGDTDAFILGNSAPDKDGDNDGNSYLNDFVVIGYGPVGALGDTYFIHRPNDPIPAGCQNTLNTAINTSAVGMEIGVSISVTTPISTCFDGTYHAIPEGWGNESSVKGSVSMFPQKLPRLSVDKTSGLLNNDKFNVRLLWADYDSDNDAWEDKFDDFPNDPQRH